MAHEQSLDAGNRLRARKSKWRKRESGGARGIGIGAGDSSILEHAGIGDVKLVSIGRQRDSKWQPADLDGCHCLAGFYVDDGHTKVGLVGNVENAVLGIVHQVARKAVVVAVLVQFEGAAAVIGSIEISDAPGIAFRHIEAAVGGEGDSGGHAFPIGAGAGADRFNRAKTAVRDNLTIFKFAGPQALQNADGIDPRSTIGGGERFSRWTHDQAKSAGPHGVLIAKWRDDSAAGQDGSAAFPHRRADAGGRGMRLGCEASAENQQRQRRAPDGEHLSIISTAGTGKTLEIRRRRNSFLRTGFHRFEQFLPDPVENATAFRYYLVDVNK